MQSKKTETRPPVAKKAPPKSLIFLLLPALLVITGAVYYTSLSNELTNWDDNVTISTMESDAGLRSFGGDSLYPTLKKTFSVRGDMIMYAPLTGLSFAVQYNSFGKNPAPYHLLNYLLHLLNTALVFWFIWLLCGQTWVAFTTALLFGVHPMHVESVAWVTGRIDVLYSFFYLAALCAYLLYLKPGKGKWVFYAAAFFLFILSGLSKVAAVILPLAFFAIDYFRGRKITLKVFFEKAPFLLFSLVFGYIALDIQKHIAITEDISQYHFFDKMLFTSYALTGYLWKLVAPVDLSNVYNYPLKHPSELFSGQPAYPFIFYAAPFIVAAAIFLIYKSGKYRKDILFGFGFFFIHIALLLPGLAMRNTIIADRYTYISYIGLFFIPARALQRLWESREAGWKAYKIPSIIAFSALVVWFCYLSVERCEIWRDSISLWDDALRYNPDYAISHLNRGKEYLDRDKYQEALDDFTAAIRLKPDLVKAINNRADTYMALGKKEEAISDYTEAIRLKPDFADAYYNRGTAYCSLGQYLKGIDDFSHAIFFDPKYTAAYLNRGNTYSVLKQYDEAVNDYTSAIRLKPEYGKAFNNRAVAYFHVQKFKPALDDLMKAKELGCAVDSGFVANLREKTRETGE